MAA
ncbi:hypothetical protein ECEC1862_2275, partial [Escherichia coli EC1862]|jgi:hypothetical protein